MRPTTTRADVGGYPALPLEDLPVDIDTFANAGAIAFLVWDWDGSIAGGGVICDILREKSAQYPNVIFGTNVYNLADTGQASTYLTNLKNNCNGTMIRFWAANPATSTLSLTAPEISATLDTAAGAGVSAIVAIGDWGGFLNFQQEWVIEPAIDHANPLGWYAERYITKGYPLHLREVLSAVKGKSALWGVELANEAHCGSQSDAIGAYNSWASNMSGLASTLTGANIGVGQMNSENGSACDYPSGNFVALHSSGFALNVASGHFYTEDMRANVLAALQISPVPFYIGEAGYDDERSDFQCVPTSGTLSSEYIDWHTLRPFPLCPWDPVPAELDYFMCGHDLVTQERFSIDYEDVPDYAIGFENIYLDGCESTDTESAIVHTCDFIINGRKIHVKADVDNLDFPVMGLTEPEYVANISQQTTDDITHAQKMNEYVSWYLHGVTGRGEYPYPQTTDEDKFKRGGGGYTGRDFKKLTIDYAGPLRKQLPWRIQIGQRVKQVVEAEVERHNQIVGCVWKINVATFSIPFTSISWSINAGHTPDSCIEDYQLEGNAINLGPFGSISFGEHERLYLTNWKDGVTDSNVGTGGLKIPPFDENEEFADDDGNFDFRKYWKAYLDWRGYDCSFDVAGFNLCFDLPLDLNFHADMFYLIPFTSTDDRIGVAFTDGTYTRQPPSNAIVSNVRFTPLGTATNPTDGVNRYLYFPHMDEGVELGILTQSTYVPHDEKGAWLDEEGYVPTETKGLYDTEYCELVVDDIHPGERLQDNSNAADDQYGIEGDLTYDGFFTCVWYEQKPTCDNAWPGQTHCNTDLCQPFTCQSDGTWVEAGEEGVSPCEGVPGACITHSSFNPPPIGPTCTIEINVAISMYDIVPRVQEVYDRYVAGPMSIFKRFYPNFDQISAPVKKIQDLAVRSHQYANYTSSGTQTLAGDPNRNRPGSKAEWFWPHLGSVYCYFTKGVQYAFRPQELITRDHSCEQTVQSGASDTPDIPGSGDQCEDLMSCYDPAVTSNYISDTSMGALQGTTLEGAINAAAAKYNIQACAIWATLSVEGSAVRATSPEEQAILTSAWEFDDPMQVFTEQFGLSQLEAEDLFGKAYCSDNSAGAGGAFQLTGSAWNQTENASYTYWISKGLVEGLAETPHIPNKCNFIDSVFGFAEHVTHKLCSLPPWDPPYGYGYDCGTDYANNPAGSLSDPAPFCYLGEGQYGSCRMDTATCRLGTNYCDYILEYCGIEGSCSGYKPTAPRACAPDAVPTPVPPIQIPPAPPAPPGPPAPPPPPLTQTVCQPANIGPINLSYGQGGIWLTPSEIQQIPTNNSSWDSLVSYAKRSMNIVGEIRCTAGGACSDTDTPQAMYARAVVGLRTNNQTMINELKAELDRVDDAIYAAQGDQDEKWPERNIALIAVAANIIDYRPTALTTALRTLMYEWKFDGNKYTIREVSLRALPNKPAYGRWSLLATAYLLEDWNTVNAAVKAHAKAMGEPTWGGATNNHIFTLTGLGSRDDWQTLQPGGKSDPIAIMPAGIYYQDHGVGGLWLADQYRAGFGPTWPPSYTNYIYEGMAPYNAFSWAAYHLGYNNVFDLGNCALLRAAIFQNSSFDGKPSWAASGNDTWQIAAIMTWAKAKYPTSLPADLKPEPGANVSWPLSVTPSGGPGRGMGWMYATHYARLAQ